MIPAFASNNQGAQNIAVISSHQSSDCWLFASLIVCVTFFCRKVCTGLMANLFFPSPASAQTQLIQRKSKSMEKDIKIAKKRSNSCFENEHSFAVSGGTAAPVKGLQFRHVQS